MVGPSVAVLAVFCLFKYVITDEDLVLSYLRVLAWPLVLVGVVYWFRGPLANRVENLESVDSPWWTARFEKKAAKRLTAELGTVLIPFSKAADESTESDSDDGDAPHGPDEVNTKRDDGPGEATAGDETDDSPVGDGGGGEVVGVDRIDAKGEHGVVDAARPTTERSPASQLDMIRGMELRNVAGLLQGKSYIDAVYGAEDDPDGAAWRLTAVIRRRFDQL